MTLDPAPRLRTLIGACILGVMVLLSQPVAAAAEPAKLTPAEVEALVEKAQTLIATRNVVQALAIYERIYEATGATKHLYNIGYLYEDMGELAVAWDYYQRFLLAWPDAPNSAELRSYLDELAADLGKTHVLVHVFSTPPGASLDIVTGGDTRRPFGVTPISTWMPVGEVLIRLRLAGHAMRDEKITVKRRKSQRLKLTMEPIIVPGRLTCGEMAPGATLAIDGKAQPNAGSGVELSLDPGEHSLVLRLSDGTERTATVTVADGSVSALPDNWWSGPVAEAKEDPVEPDPPEDPPSTSADVALTTSVGDAGVPIPVGAWVTGGVAVASIVSAAVVMGMAHAKAGEAKESADLIAQYNTAGLDAEADLEYATWKPLEDDAKMLQSTSIALFALGGAAATASVLWWLLDSPSEAPPDATLVVPLFFDDGLGAAATWRF